MPKGENSGYQLFFYPELFGTSIGKRRDRKSDTGVIRPT